MVLCSAVWKGARAVTWMGKWMAEWKVSALAVPMEFAMVYLRVVVKEFCLAALLDISAVAQLEGVLVAHWVVMRVLSARVVVLEIVSVAATGYAEAVEM